VVAGEAALVSAAACWWGWPAVAAGVVPVRRAPAAVCRWGWPARGPAMTVVVVRARDGGVRARAGRRGACARRTAGACPSGTSRGHAHPGTAGCRALPGRWRACRSGPPRP